MEGFKCTKCRKLHESEAKFCYFCGEDLEDAILEYKEKHHPIKFERKILSLPTEKNDEIQEKGEIRRDSDQERDVVRRETRAGWCFLEALIDAIIEGIICCT
jgi:hypothetical protein